MIRKDLRLHPSSLAEFLDRGVPALRAGERTQRSGTHTENLMLPMKSSSPPLVCHFFKVKLCSYPRFLWSQAWGQKCNLPNILYLWNQNSRIKGCFCPWGRLHKWPKSLPSRYPHSAMWLSSSTYKRSRAYLCSPWLWVSPCDLLWMIKWGRINGIPVNGILGFKKLFLPPLWCFWHHYKDIFWPRKRKKKKPSDHRRMRNMWNRDAQV